MAGGKGGGGAGPRRAPPPPATRGKKNTPRPGGNAGHGLPHPPAANAMKQYTVQPGDSLSKIAQAQMGSSSKANRDAIVKANPSLAANPDKVIIGMTYIIPPAAAPATGAVVAQ